MKASTKFISTVVVLFVSSHLAFAELAGSKGANANGAPGIDLRKPVCPARAKIDPVKANACPKSLGELPLEPREEVEYVVDEYHPETESYTILGVKLPDEGDFPVTLEALAKAEGSMVGAKDNKEKLAALKKSLTSPCDILKKRFKIKKIQTLSDNDLKARKDCVRK